tara:strand:- start:12380 stop:12838 length:459 start_codon:yes stop_codon:yes gene_type:complete
MYLGLDCSTFAIHGAVVDDQEQLIALHKWGSKQKNFEARFPEILVGFSDELSRITLVTIAAIEAAIFIQNPKTTIAIAHVVGAAWGFLLNAGISATLIDNRQWKKVVLGKGNASKEDIKRFAEDKWGDWFPEQDYADAACIALWNKRRFANG